MAVRKIRRKGSRRKAVHVTKAAPAAPDGLALPTTKKEIETDFLRYIVLIYGREKIGKTTLFSQFPDIVFAATEPGTKGISVFEFNAEDGGVRDWAIFRTMVDLLVNTDHQFKGVCIDTADRAYDMCLDWVCANRGIEYPGETASGDEDWGKSWRAVRTEFMEQIHRLRQAGLGIYFTSHSKETTIRTRSGEKYSRIFPSMSGQARTVIEALVDFFFYAEYVKTGQGTERVLICEGDETIWAGARASLVGVFPQFIPMLRKGGFEILKDAFEGNYSGLNAAALRPTKSTTETAGTFIKGSRVRATRQPMKKGAKEKAVKKKPRRVR